MSFPSGLAREGEELVTYQFPSRLLGAASSLDLKRPVEPPPVRPRTFWTVLRDIFGSPAPEVRIPTMSISHSDLMPIRAERSDAGLSQCETLIGIGQYFCSSTPSTTRCFWALTEGARRATGVSAQKHFGTRSLLAILRSTPTSFLAHRLAL